MLEITFRNTPHFQFPQKPSGTNQSPPRLEIMQYNIEIDFPLSISAFFKFILITWNRSHPIRFTRPQHQPKRVPTTSVLAIQQAAQMKRSSISI